MPQRIVAMIFLPSVTSLYLTVVGSIFLVLGEVDVFAQANLERHALEIMAAIMVFVGGFLHVYERYKKQKLKAYIDQQQAEREEFVKWSQVKGPSMETKMIELNRKFEEAVRDRAEIKKLADERQAMNMELLLRLERLTIANLNAVRGRKTPDPDKI